MGDWQAWAGREEQHHDRVDEALAARWLATFDRVAPDDEIMPQGFHWCLCAPDAATATLGPDGHPLRNDDPGSFLPPVPHLPRRMWASSQVEFLVPLRQGDTVRRRSSVQTIEAKSGGSGELLFVTVNHETFAGEALTVREVQSLVYRAAASADAPLSPPPPGSERFDALTWDATRVVTPSEALLFRYSALTFNSHRIHYDLPYARDVERYRGLVVHGPLTATLLLDLAQRELGDNALSAFSFRGLSPAICGEDLHLVMRKTTDAYELGAFASDGRQVAIAAAA
ncbi:MAG: MaoC family dehydratase N-terminal domain-containing protein [Novosphingobium sp.]|uniref:FAS1-like dehydratase domain-containing protein n=1 Tax=Novosphingobium sp. TaxID=1874826 RepID=UPI003C7CA0E9